MERDRLKLGGPLNGVAPAGEFEKLMEDGIDGGGRGQLSVVDGGVLGGVGDHAQDLEGDWRPNRSQNCSDPRLDHIWTGRGGGANLAETLHDDIRLVPGVKGKRSVGLTNES